MNIVVTGATGFVGRALIARLALTHNVWAVARRASDWPPNVAPIIWDMRQPLEPTHFPAQLDAVIHLAQSRRYRDFPEGSEDLVRINVTAPIELLNWAVRSDVQRFCLVSTGSVYEPYDGVLSEAAAISPRSMHASSKLACEILTRPFEALVPISRLRLFFPYGPGQTDRLVPDLIDRIRTGRPIELAGGTGGLEFCPTFISDITSVIQTAVEDAWTGTVNVASPNSIVLEDFAGMLGEALGCKPTFRREPERVAQRIVPCIQEFMKRYDTGSMVLPAHGVIATVS